MVSGQWSVISGQCLVLSGQEKVAVAVAVGRLVYYLLLLIIGIDYCESRIGHSYYSLGIRH